MNPAQGRHVLPEPHPYRGRGIAAGRSERFRAGTGHHSEVVVEPTYVDDNRVAFPADARVRELYERANAGNPALRELLGQSYDPRLYDLKDHVVVDRPGAQHEDRDFKGNVQLGKASREALGDSSKRGKVASAFQKVATVTFDRDANKYFVNDAKDEEQSNANLRNMEGSPEFYRALETAFDDKFKKAAQTGHGFAGSNFYVWLRNVRGQESDVALTFVPGSGFVDKATPGKELVRSQENFRDGARGFLGELAKTRLDKEMARMEAFEQLKTALPPHVRDNVKDVSELLALVSAGPNPSMVLPAEMPGQGRSEMAAERRGSAVSLLSDMSHGELSQGRVSALSVRPAEMTSEGRPPEVGDENLPAEMTGIGRPAELDGRRLSPPPRQDSRNPARGAAAGSTRRLPNDPPSRRTEAGPSSRDDATPSRGRGRVAK